MSGLAACWDFDAGLSADAKRLQEEFRPAAPSIAATYGGLLWELADATAEASTPGWDGYNAKPVSKAAALRAQSFVQHLWQTWPRPEVLVDPDGDIWFQWQRDSSRTFAVAVGSGEFVHYAGLFGASRVRGMEMLNERLLGVVAESLERLYPDAPAAHLA